MKVEWSTQSVSPEKRYSAWVEASCEIVGPYASERHSREPFHGHVVRWQSGPLDVIDVQCDGHLVRRRPEDISAKACNTWYIFQQLEGRALGEQRNRQVVTEPGDIVLVDPDLPYTSGTDHPQGFRIWCLDPSRLRPLLAHGGSELPVIKFEPGNGETILLSSWLDALYRTRARLSGTGLNLASDTLYALLANAAGIAPELREQSHLGRRTAMLQRVMRQIELRAAEPGLNAEKIAAEFAISLRGLYQLFELSKTTFHEYLVEVRLAKAYSLLCDPGHAHRGIVEIGLVAGFSETATFYRRFKSRYDATPGEIRSAMAQISPHHDTGQSP